MDRFVLLVDAGYVLAEGGNLTCGTKNRKVVDCSHEGLIHSLVKRAREHCELSLLRSYWYDGAQHRVPNTEQRAIGNLTSVKLRLGRLSGGRQKGVDSLIYRDLTTLARNKAVTTAYLLSGDEDVREGVVDAQDMGVRVVLMGIECAHQGGNQSETLIREADDHIVFGRAALAPFFKRKTSNNLITFEQTAAAAAPELSGDQPTADRLPAQPQATETAESSSVEKVAAEFATSWINGATSEGLTRLIDRAPFIPGAIDRRLRSAIEERYGSTEQEDVRRRARAAFWKTVRQSDKE